MNRFKCVRSLQTAELEVLGQQRQMDFVNSRGKQLLQEVRVVPQMDVTNLKQEMNNTNNDWQTTTKVSQFYKFG